MQECVSKINISTKYHMMCLCMAAAYLKSSVVDEGTIGTLDKYLRYVKAKNKLATDLCPPPKLSIICWYLVE